MVAKSAAQRNREKEQRKYEAGLREIRVWVPDREVFGEAAEKRVRRLAADLCAAAKSTN